jgi:hypothetical protein
MNARTIKTPPTRVRKANVLPRNQSIMAIMKMVSLVSMETHVQAIHCANAR